MYAPWYNAVTRKWSSKMFRKTFFVLLTFAAIPVSAKDAQEILEPCINGGVSASGNYATQELEDLTLAFFAKYSSPNESPEPPMGLDVSDVFVGIF
jgi:hypothetical protein